MKGKTILEQLEDYVSSTLKSKRVTKKTASDWAFGAIDFALSAGLIDREEEDHLLQKYDLG